MSFAFPHCRSCWAVIALFVALGGGAAVAATQFVNNAGHLGGQPPSYYLASKHFVSSGGEKFLHVGQTEVSATPGTSPSPPPARTRAAAGGQQVTFDVTANTTADMDANAARSPPGPRSTSTPIATRWTPPDAPLNAGDFDQVGSALTRPRSPPTARKSTCSTTTASTGPPATAARRTTASPATPDSLGRAGVDSRGPVVRAPVPGGP